MTREPTAPDTAPAAAHAASREGRPDWWPAGRPWPPRSRREWWHAWRAAGGPAEAGGPPWAAGGPPWARARRARGAFARRLGCLAFLFVGLVVSTVLAGLWSLGALLGLLHPAGGMGDVFRGAAAVVLVAGAVALAAGIRAIRSLGEPIGELVDAAGRLEAGDYGARVGAWPGAAPELRRLGAAFNTMAARLEADEAERQRLLADVSHELRTPLAVIQGNLEALVDGIYPADEAHLAPILEETAVLSRLVDDLRTVALAEAGTLALHRESTDLATLVHDVVASFEPAAVSAGASLSARVADGLPLLELDPIRIREVLANLLANALRYAGEGGAVLVEALGERQGPSADRVVVRVSDDGPGIPADLLPHVFERFARSADSRGSGLGLAIARGIVAAHGGEIRATSAPGAGTTIAFSLPVAQG